MAAPIWLVIQTIPQTLARLRWEIQRPITTDAFGYAPASPAPKQNRTNSSSG